MTDHDCPHAATLRNLLDACERGRPLADITDRLRVEVGRLAGEGTTQPDPSEHHGFVLAEDGLIYTHTDGQRCGVTITCPAVLESLSALIGGDDA